MISQVLARNVTLCTGVSALTDVGVLTVLYMRQFCAMADGKLGMALTLGAGLCTHLRCQLVCHAPAHSIVFFLCVFTQAFCLRTVLLQEQKREKLFFQEVPVSRCNLHMAFF